LTTVRQLITDGFREAGIIALGTDPDAEAHEEGLRHVNRLFRSLLGNELGDHLTNVYYEDIETLDYIPLNVRVLCDLDADETLTLSSAPRDGSRLGILDVGGNFATNNLILLGNGSRIEDVESLTLSTNLLNREWLYRADLGNWARITDLAADDLSPLPEEFDDLFTTLLAFRLNPRYGGDTGVNLLETLRRMRSQLRARYGQVSEQTVDDGILRVPSLTRHWFYDYNDFNMGL